MASSERARQNLEREGGPAFLTAWHHVVFVHLAIDPTVLQPLVPVELDVRDGEAYVSVVMFDQDPIRPASGGTGARLFRLSAPPRLCNLRTYVRSGTAHGVYFMREWISDPLTALIAPLTYGLPTWPAQITYERDHSNEIFFGHVTVRTQHLDVLARLDYAAPVAQPEPGSLDAFLLERYVGFTGRRVQRSFDIWHVPWRQQAITAEIVADSLLEKEGWYRAARVVAAGYSPGVESVLLGRPRPGNR